MTSNQQTPLEKLQMEKLRLTKACETQEHKLNEHFAYIQENAGSLLLSGLSSILFSSSPNKGKGKSQDSSATDNKESVATPINIGIGDYFSIAKGLAPLLWDIAQPIVASWGIKQVRKWITNKLFKKKVPAKAKESEAMPR